VLDPAQLRNLCSTVAGGAAAMTQSSAGQLESLLATAHRLLTVGAVTAIWAPRAASARSAMRSIRCYDLGERSL